jgi:N-acetyl-anhydromuramyl-L-alanine amidase AmpD
VQKNKVDPGPAFQWDKVIDGARRLLKQPEPKGGARALQPQER